MILFLKRELPKVITAADTNFYVAFRMAYQYEGANKWAGLSLLDSDGFSYAKSEAVSDDADSNYAEFTI